ncbi:hypothetical protein CC80DRAFT_583094 [Byssothecium circinans]|uniref:Heterokaryon incompatibility domain-containing protein n=1 Tax=Byssothecium circinans TaxID=147558 RepID=A0A6A5U6V7_9PLEO|nr:hypothetical protein CC80DRAFT_583094 [Byssothecium circinans]
MANVYGNSFVTLAATKSADAHGGLFSSTWDLKIQVQDSYGTKIPVYCRPRSGHYLGQTRLELLPYHRYFPLLERGWVLQERFLSPRVLHFTTEELIWECMESTTCECSGVAADLGDSLPPKKNFAEAYNASETNYQIQGWRDLVSHYSTLQLSYESDRLPALASMAELMKTRIGAEYVAGLWKSSIIGDLAWYTLGPCKDTTSRSPSWSWTSLNSGIRFGIDATQNVHNYAVNVSENTESIGSDDMVRANSTTLKLSGLLLEAMVVVEKNHAASSVLMGIASLKAIADNSDQQSEEMDSFSPSDMPIYNEYDLIAAKSTDIIRKSWKEYFDCDFCADHYLAQEVAAGIRCHQKVFCLKLIGDEMSTFYLILARVDEKNETYRRIRLAKDSHTFQYMRNLRQESDLFHDDNNEDDLTPSISIEDWLGGANQRTINII